MKQTTLKESFTLSGKGLHTGLNITAEFLPAPENHGYKFQRTDVEGEPIIEAWAENVKSTNRGTVIGRGDVCISTIEHSMAALYAAGIDNCLIRVNAPEMPILDGSAKFVTEAIQKAGIEEQTAEKDYYVVKQKIEVRDDTTGSSIVVLPDEDFSIDTMVAFDSPVIPNQFASLDSLSAFSTEIAPSRTFVFVREIEPLLKSNLIKGGDLDNAIVIYDSPMEQSELDHIADMMSTSKRLAISTSARWNMKTNPRATSFSTCLATSLLSVVRSRAKSLPPVRVIRSTPPWLAKFAKSSSARIFRLPSTIPTLSR
jgi:UDP-3-O-[3-hydroxymyristoyl] N-acetylglucosamine deacetylase/3-hydroxyacyl-[acyl-carrier-protein] dehydratase